MTNKNAFQNPPLWPDPGHNERIKKILAGELPIPRRSGCKTLEEFRQKHEEFISRPLPPPLCTPQKRERAIAKLKGMGLKNIVRRMESK